MSVIIGTPHTKGAGYFLNDRNLSDRQEADIRTCTHCQAVIKMQEWKQDGAWCGKCMAPICGSGRCAEETAKFGCVPFLKKIEQHAETQMRFDRFRKDAGLDEPVTPQIILTGTH